MIFINEFFVSAVYLWMSHYATTNDNGVYNCSLHWANNSNTNDNTKHRQYHTVYRENYPLHQKYYSLHQKYYSLHQKYYSLHQKYYPLHRNYARAKNSSSDHPTSLRMQRWDGGVCWSRWALQLSTVSNFLHERIWREVSLWFELVRVFRITINLTSHS